MYDRVCVRVPATTANLGPAYDTLGLALDIWLELTIEKAEEFELIILGEGASEIPANKDNLVVKCVEKVYKEHGMPMPVLRYQVKSAIPFGCGCGSSSAAAVAGLLAAFAMIGRPISFRNETLLQLACEVEGHPDNAAPAIYGGLQLSFHNSKRYQTCRMNSPHNLHFVLFIPKKKMKLDTHATRKLLPTEVSVKDAVYNISRASLLAFGLTTGRLEVLKNCVGEKLHQDSRAPLFPHMNACFDAAMAAGAKYCCLSGAGPTIIAFVEEKSTELLTMAQNGPVIEGVAEALMKAGASQGVEGSIVVTGISEQGAHVTGICPYPTNPMLEYSSVMESCNKLSKL